MTRRFIVSGALLAALAAASPAQAEWSKLLTPAELQALAASREIDIIDIRAAEPGKPDEKGKVAPNYAAGHIPGSVSAPYGSWRGTEQNPGLRLTDDALSARLASAGLEPGDPVVIVYEGADQTDFGAAARVYWTLKSAGFEEIAILNGGLAEWRRAGLPLTTDGTAPTPTEVTARLSEQWSVTREEIHASIGASDAPTLIDARPLKQHLGQEKHKLAKAAGAIEGARSVPHSTFFDGEASVTLSPEKVREWAAANAPGADETVVTYCNTGHWAATDWFALSEIAGLPDVRMYPESMVDWTNAGLPVVTPK